MKYYHRVFKAKRGTRVVVRIDKPAKVMLIQDFHYQSYVKHKTYDYRGGMMDGSVCNFDIPNDGLWHIVIERGGYFNPLAITASVEVLPPKKD